MVLFLYFAKVTLYKLFKNHQVDFAHKLYFLLKDKPRNEVELQQAEHSVWFLDTFYIKFSKLEKLYENDEILYKKLKDSLQCSDLLKAFLKI